MYAARFHLAMIAMAIKTWCRLGQNLALEGAWLVNATDGPWGPTGYSGSSAFHSGRLRTSRIARRVLEYRSFPVLSR